MDSYTVGPETVGQRLNNRISRLKAQLEDLYDPVNHENCVKYYNRFNKLENDIYDAKMMLQREKIMHRARAMESNVLDKAKRSAMYKARVRLEAPCDPEDYQQKKVIDSLACSRTSDPNVPYRWRPVGNIGDPSNRRLFDHFQVLPGFSLGDTPGPDATSRLNRWGASLNPSSEEIADYERESGLDVYDPYAFDNLPHSQKQKLKGRALNVFQNLSERVGPMGLHTQNLAMEERDAVVKTVNKDYEEQLHLALLQADQATTDEEREQIKGQIYNIMDFMEISPERDAAITARLNRLDRLSDLDPEPEPEPSFKKRKGGKKRKKTKRKSK